MCYLNSTQLSKYVLSMIENSRDRMNKFVMGVSWFVEKEFHRTMLSNDMEISMLMVYAQKIEESKIREIRQEVKRPRWEDSSHQNPIRGFIIKILPWETRIRLQTKIPKVVAILLRGLGALLVRNNILVDVLPEQMVVL